MAHKKNTIPNENKNLGIIKKKRKAVYKRIVDD